MPKRGVFRHFRQDLPRSRNATRIRRHLQAKARCAKQCAPDRGSGRSHQAGTKNMAGTVEQKLTAQGIVLTEPRTPMANYVGFVRSGNLLFVSGQVCANAEGTLIAKGKLGA